MKTKYVVLCTILAGLLLSPCLHGQIFTVNSNNTIGEYAVSGTPIGSGTLVSSGPDDSFGIALSGSDIFITNYLGNTINEYTTMGVPVGSGTLVSTGLAFPDGIAISGTDIFVTNAANNTVGEYTTSGTVVKASLIPSGLSDPTGIAVSGTDLFIVNAGGVSEFTTSGTSVSASLTPGLDGIPECVAVAGSDLFVGCVDGTAGTFAQVGAIEEFTTSGIAVSPSLITGVYPDGVAISGTEVFIADSLNNDIEEYSIFGTFLNDIELGSATDPKGIVVESIPEPSSLVFVAAGLGLLVGRCAGGLFRKKVNLSRGPT